MRLEQQVKELEQTQPEKAAPVRAKLEQLQQEITKGAAATPADAPAAYVLVFLILLCFFVFVRYFFVLLPTFCFLGFRLFVFPSCVLRNVLR